MAMFVVVISWNEQNSLQVHLNGVQFIYFQRRS